MIQSVESEFNPGNAATMADPFPALAALREHDPVHYNPHLRAWLITRYDDVKQLTLDMSLSSDRLHPFFATMEDAQRNRIANLIRYLARWMVFKDAPYHTRLRKLTGQVFNAATMSAQRELIERRVDRLIDALSAKRELDFIGDFAGPLPALVIMDMLGVPESELTRIKALSDEIALFIGSARASAEKYAVAEAATREMADFFQLLISERRATPADDLITSLCHTRDADSGDTLSDDELIATCILLLFAGHETTTSLLSNGLLAMLDFPEQIELLRSQPALAAAAVEEVLRFDGPNLSAGRVVAQPIELRGKTLAVGDRVFLMLSAANRDPRVYDEPDHLNFQRKSIAHLAFGWGKHICLGFPLARMEGQIAFTRLLQRASYIEQAPGELQWHRSMVFRGVPKLPLRVSWNL